MISIKFRVALYHQTINFRPRWIVYWLNGWLCNL
jgi:hypothetical protein